MRRSRKKYTVYTKYQDFATELRMLWKVKTKVIPIVVGALGTIPKGFEREKLQKSKNNDKCRVPSEDCTPWNSTHTKKGARVYLV